MFTRKQLLEHLEKNTKVLENQKIKKAFEAVDRKDFVQPDYEDEAYEDYPLPIGHEQTISQPTTVAFMLKLLDPKEGEKILDVGSGSGWTTVLLAHIVGPQGSVLGLERIVEFVSFGRKNLSKYNFEYARIEQAGNEFGRKKEAPFDKILVSAAATELPEELIAQLKHGGTMVVPIGETVCKIERTYEGAIKQRSYDGFVFVPLIKAYRNE